MQRSRWFRKVDNYIKDFPCPKKRSVGAIYQDATSTSLRSHKVLFIWKSKREPTPWSIARASSATKTQSSHQHLIVVNANTDYALLEAPLAYGASIQDTILSDIHVRRPSSIGRSHSPVHVANTCASICSYPTLATIDSYRSNRPNVSIAAQIWRPGGDGKVDESDSDSAGGRVDATRALKPWEKDGGRMENNCVWKVRVYEEDIVAPSLQMLVRLIKGRLYKAKGVVSLWRWRPCTIPF